MRCATSARLDVRSSSSSACSFFSPSAETYWGLSRLFMFGLHPEGAHPSRRPRKRKALKAARPSALRGFLYWRPVYTERAAARTLRGRLLRWYAREGRRLPWRATRDPYAILVSEVMLQQTQVARVLPAYAAFLRRFPTLRALARATLADVLRAWSGLGYNRRARDLHRIARSVPAGLPTDVSSLDTLPGVGAYTAGAVACFAAGTRVAFADTNIRRVLGRA